MQTAFSPLIRRGLLGVCLFAWCALTFRPVHAQDLLLGLTGNGDRGVTGTAFSIKGTGADFKEFKTFRADGADPYYCKVVQGRNGALYGMTTSGGQYGFGTIFRVNPDGSGYSVLYSFNGFSDGGTPRGSLRQAPDGTFYGVSFLGNYDGVFFKINEDGSNFTVLKNFFGTTGERASGTPVRDGDGFFYGLTAYGGTYDKGTLYRVSADGSSFTVLHHFKTGGNPIGTSLTLGGDGVLYGITSLNNDDQGAVFRINRNGTGFATLHTFAGADGSNPVDRLVPGKDGALYGVTSDGGKFNLGTFFKINPGGTGFTTLYHFGSDAGTNPQGILLGTDGAFYGATRYDLDNEAGVVFRINGDGTGYRRLRQMSSLRADIPSGGLTQGTGGVLYGMSTGSFNQGTVYRLNPDGTDFRMVHQFTDRYEGTNPRGSLTRGSNGALYGVTGQGGTENRGVFYRVYTDGGGFTVLSNFPNGGLENPLSELVEGKDGAFYGVATDGGNFDRGGIFRLNANGPGYTVLRQFNRTDGENPLGGLIQGSDGAFYGMTQGGGSTGNGTIYRLNGDGTGFAILKNFTAGDGRFPENRLVQGGDGALYGMTTFGGALNNGVVFRMNRDGSGFSVLRSLAAGEGRNPRGALIQGFDGAFYGTTSAGGNHNGGTVFKINGNGTGFAVLRHLGGSDGINPFAGLSQGSDGILYGLTANGGTYDGGTLFRIAPDGTGFGVRKHFNPATGGAHPEGTVVVLPTPFSRAGIRVNAGGNAFTTADARNFAADMYASGGTVSAATALGISGTADDYLYQTGRHGASFTYNFPTGNGTFDVVLHFAETYWGNTVPGGIGSRRFHVNMEGVRKLSDYDIFARAGGALRVAQETFRVTVGDGTLNVAFLKGAADNPAVKAIEVLPAGSALTINAGGERFSASGGKVFWPDAYYNGGSRSGILSGVIANTNDHALYRDARVGVFSYGLPSGNGTFNVTLHFAETYWGHRAAGGVGSRRFHVDAEGVRRLTNYDIIAKTGGAMRAISETFRVTVTDGVLNLFFSRGAADNPLVSAIEVVPVSATARLSETAAATEPSGITLYPNPVSDKLLVTLPFPATQVSGTTVVDASGRVWLRNTHVVSGVRELSIRTATLPPGLYLLRVDTPTGAQPARFIKQ